MADINENYNVFTLGYDLMMWKSPYCINWVFHHPKQNIDKPDGSDSITIIVKNDKSNKIVGIKNLEWNGKEQISKINTIDYKNINNFTYGSEGVSFEQSLRLEHQNIEQQFKENNLFKEIKRKFSHFNDIGNIECSLIDDSIYTFFDDYRSNIYSKCGGSKFYGQTARGDIKNYQPEEFTVKRDEEYDFIGYLFAGISTEFNINNGLIERVRINAVENNRNSYSTEQEELAAATWAGVKSGISSIYIKHKYNDLNDMLCEVKSETYHDNYSTTECWDEKVSYNFDDFPYNYPSSSTVEYLSEIILEWKYYYEDGSLIKMNLVDKKNDLTADFSIEYNSTNTNYDDEFSDVQ